MVVHDDRNQSACHAERSRIVGRRKDTMPCDNNSVMSTAHDHNHQSRRSTMPMLSRTAAYSVNSWGSGGGALRKPLIELTMRRRKDLEPGGPEQAGTSRPGECPLRAVPADAICQ